MTLNDELKNLYKTASAQLRDTSEYIEVKTKIVDELFRRIGSGNRNGYAVKVETKFVWPLYDEFIANGLYVKLYNSNELYISMAY